MSIRTRILLMLIPAILLLLGILLISNFTSSRDTVLELINMEANEISESRVKEFDVVFETSAKVAEGIAISVSTMENLNKKDIEKVISNTLKKNRSIFGSTVALIPDATNLGNFAPYYYNNGNKLVSKSLTTKDYNYTNQEWFTTPIKNNKGTWSDAYMDTGGGNIIMTTYSEPIHYKGKTIGVATIDISIQNLVNKVRKLTISGEGYAFMVTKDGRLIAYPRRSDISAETIWQISKTSPDLKAIIKYITQLKENFVEINDPINHTPAMLLTNKITATGWTLAIVYPRDQILEPLFSLRNRNILYSGIIIILIMGLTFYVSSSITKPITGLVKQTEKYSKGIYDQPLNESVGIKEIQQLSVAFNKMGQSIIEYIENVKTTTAQKESYQRELQIAANIQQAILPQRFPPFPELQDKFDLHAITKAAKEIGGDFYDIFRISDSRIAFVVADVSGKGAPSSFFMAMAQRLIKAFGSIGLAPSEVIRRTNYLLALNNPECMFVTIAYADYDLNTGIIRLVNGGHYPPIIIDKDGKVSEQQVHKNLPIGIDEGVHYRTDEFILEKGNSLLLLTDGITETFDKDEKMIPADLLNSIFAETKGLTSKKAINHIVQKVAEYRGEVPQYDDETLLILKNISVDTEKDEDKKLYGYNTINLTLPASTDIIGDLGDYIMTIAKNKGYTEKQANEIYLAMDEIINNVIMHAYKDNPKETFQVSITPDEDQLTISIFDYGESFNFKKSLDAYDAEEASVDQKVGGIGLFLAKKATDEIFYVPGTLNGNMVTFVKKLKT